MFDDRVLVSQSLQNAHIGRESGLGLPHGRQLQFVEQHIPQLLCRIDVERLSGELVNLPGQVLELALKLFRHIPQAADVDRYAGLLHLCEDRDQREFDLLAQLDHPLLLEFGREGFVELEGHISILTGVVRERLGGNVPEQFPILARSREVVIAHSLVLKIFLCERIQVVPAVRTEDVVGDHRIEPDPIGPDPILREDQHVVLDVVADFSDCRILQDRHELFYHVEGLKAASVATGRSLLIKEAGPWLGAGLAHGDEKRFVRPEGEGDSDKFCVQRVGGGGLRIEDELLCLPEL